MRRSFVFLIIELRIYYTSYQNLFHRYWFQCKSPLSSAFKGWGGGQGEAKIFKCQRLLPSVKTPKITILSFIDDHQFYLKYMRCAPGIHLKNQSWKLLPLSLWHLKSENFLTWNHTKKLKSFSIDEYPWIQDSRSRQMRLIILT